MISFKSLNLKKLRNKCIQFLGWVTFILIIGCMLGTTTMYVHDHVFTKIDGSVPYRIQYEKEAELAYWDARYLLNCEVQNYIDSVASTSNLRAYDLIEMTEKYNVDIKFVLAQGEIESHFGTRGIAARTNSVWNVGAYDGASVDEIHGKHKFHHPNESIEPYLQLLTTKYLVDGKLEVDLMKSYITKSGARYATAKDYESRLKAKYDWITDHTHIDALYEQLRYYAIKCGRS